MKKLTLLLVTILVLVSSIIFSGCDDGYKKLKITADVESIELVLDDENLCSTNLIFELSGVKSWGEISIDSNPSGLVDIEYEIKDKLCAVKVNALYPTGDGATLVITHLGSGKSASVPLNIGCKLQSVASNGTNYVIQTPTFAEDEEVKEFEIPTKQLLNCEPANYTDIIVWQTKNANTYEGIRVVSYDNKGNETPAFTQQGAELTQGVSNAINSVILVDKNYQGNTAITLNPISILDGKAILHKDVEVKIAIVDLIESKDIKIISDTHGTGTENELKDLVLINNPDSANPRKLDNFAGFDLYSTAVIDFKREVSGDGNEIVLEHIGEVNNKIKGLLDKNLYDIQISTNINALTLQEVEFGKIRVIATSTCVGKGEIVVKFTPNDCVGDVKEFSLTIPCTVGERATGFKATNNGQEIEIAKQSEYTFSSATLLKDSSSLGQAFKFEVLGTNTLSALKKYVIKIDKKLLYIEPLTTQPNDWTQNWGNYYIYNGTSYQKVSDDVCPVFKSGMYYSNRNILQNNERVDLSDLERFENLISILKDGKQVIFYDEGEDYFVSEPITANQTLYMKWMTVWGLELDSDNDFGIKVCNYYDNSYDIANNGFDKTIITYNLSFNRQRTVESISYVPVKLTINGMSIGKDIATDAGDDWQFYFEQNMLSNEGEYYGLLIQEVLGLNGSQLTEAELSDIDISISIDKNSNVGFGLLDTTDYSISNYTNLYTFNFDSGISDYKNIIIIGKTGSEANCGDYIINFAQGDNIITSQNLKVYMELTENDVTINIPNAEFNGELLQYQYVPTLKKPDDWNDGANYYEFVGGEYVQANSQWRDSKAYYIIVAKNDENGNYFELSNKEKMYLNKAYILETSKQYDVNIAIKDSDFRNISGQTVVETMVSLKDKELSTIVVSTNVKGDKIYTNNIGSFNTSTNEQNYIKLEYTIRAYTYDYYKQNTNDTTEVRKVIYLYVYEPVKLATFDSTMIYKYDYNSIPNTQLKEEYGKHTLNININNNITNMLNYANIKWSYIDNGISNFELKSENSVTFTFRNDNDIPATGSIMATIIQFGVQYTPIVCGYSVRKPVLTDEMVLDTKINNFVSGDGFINLKVGESIQINATAKSNKLDGEGNNLPISLPGFNYIICSTAGYVIDSVASINQNGLLTATSAGRAKLIIVPKDRMRATSDSDSIGAITNYFNTGLYLQKNVYLIIDIIVSDGTKENPFLIASASDFRNIANDYYYTEIKDGKLVKINASGDTTKTNDYHYALVSNIDLNGQAITFNNFSGTLSSYQEKENSNNRFTIYGVMLNESNPNLFVNLNENDDGLASIKDIDLHININYVATSAGKSVSVGLIGVNKAIIENVTIIISGQINATNLANNYTIGSMVAINSSAGKILWNDTTLIGVQGNIIVTNSGSANVILGGIVGENQGEKDNQATIQGANTTSSISNYEKDDLGAYVFDQATSQFVAYDASIHEGQQRYKYVGDEVEYKVYYDNQGATADIYLQVIGVEDGNSSAIGGIVGFNNNGIIKDVYSMGTILGIDQANKLTVGNVGGLIGKNDGSKFTINKTITTKQINDTPSLNTLTFAVDAVFQINNSYSSAIVKGLNNVGGAVGSDNKGSYKKVYYEMYTSQQSVTGNNNVGGLIGYANDSNLYYCYANNFAWGYKSSVEVYDIVGVNNVGGLIGYAKSSRDGGFNDDGAMNIVSSLASVSLTGTQDVSGLVGRLEYYGAIYTAYFYGVINPNISVLNSSPITKMYTDDGQVENIPYNNAYSIVNDVEKVNNLLNDNEALIGFNVNDEYNNGKPYIIYVDENDVQSNLVSIIPTKIEINKAFETGSDGGYYNPDNNKMYKDNAIGDYVWNKTDKKYEEYNPNVHTDVTITRYSLMAEVVDTGDDTGNNSDYRAKALVLYYYQFSDMTSENALNDLYHLNTINMHDIVSDQGVIVLPNTLKRFNLRTSDSSIVSVLSGGKLLLNSEGQATITLISTLNPSVSASFVVIVRTKVLKFNLYSSANLRNEYNLSNPDNNIISIVKNSSKIIYADYSSIIEVNGRSYAYKPATNMQLQFEITHPTIEGKDINKYIILNGDVTTLYKVDENGNRIKYRVDENGQYVKDKENGNYIIDENGEYMVDKYIYTISYGTPITITVLDYISGSFTITARPYVIATYKNETYTNDIVIPLSNYFTTSFNVVTKKGASAINTDKTQINIMPADDASKSDVKITTDIKQSTLYFEIEAVGDKWETANPANPSEKIQFIEMLDILYGGKIEFEYETNKDGVKVLAKGEININDTTKLENSIQSVKNLTLKLNDKSYYVDEAFTLQVTFYVLGADNNRITTTLHINVQPQAISSVISLNYRMKDEAGELDIDNSYQSQIIRPGSTNIITIDIAPDVAVFDHAHIIDLTTQDKILLQQVDEGLRLPEYMDTWSDDGINLVKYDSDNKYNSLKSKFYVLARLPEDSTANISHTLKITIFDKDNNVLYTTYLIIDAVMYPTVVMTYTDPNGKVVAEADTRYNTITHAVSKTADLAMGVEAGIDVVASNIDQGALQHSITITSGDNGENDYTAEYGEMVSLHYQYGKYFLQFNPNMEDKWDALIGKQINVSFTASKSLNGVTETCKATIEFTIRRIVIHSVSMANTNTDGKIHGNWDKELEGEEDKGFETYFYFNYTDISYYYRGHNTNISYRGYWNVKYTLDNTNPTNYDDGTTLQADMKAINDILVALNRWNKEGNSSIKLYLASLDETIKEPLTKNYKNDDESISIKNENNKFVINAKTGADINNMKLMIEFGLEYDTNEYPKFSSAVDATKISNNFGFDVTKPTNPFENYILLYNQADFETMAEGEFYQLANDIELTNYVPLNVKIGGLNGNGKTIKFVKSEDKQGIYSEFNVAQLILDYTAGGMYVGLFGTLATDSVIQNLQVDYGKTLINLNDSSVIQEQHANNIYFGGIAGVNLGVITNVKVYGSFELKAQYIGADHVNLGGITAINGASDSTKVATITGSTVELNMSSMALIGGIAETNYGKIVNTNFKGSIISNDSNDSNQYVAEVSTAGFVVQNMRGGYISLSYVDCETDGGNDIDSVGRTAGFVLNNAGTINNCYIIRTKISSQGNIGGFVYQSGGDISNSYAYAQLGNSLFYNGFVYVTNNIGKITNCYLVSDDNITINVSGLIKIKTYELTNQEKYKGFIFANDSDGIWLISNNGPQQPNAGFKSNSDAFNIYDIITFNEYFKTTSVDGIIVNSTFRLVRDIDFESSEWLDNPTTFNKILQSSFEGNDMELANYNIYKSGDVDSIGLFARIEASEHDTYVRNLILKPASIKASNSSAVGALAGTINGAKIYNITIDNNDLMILGKNAVGGLAGVIKGAFQVIGINSNVSAFATYSYNLSQQYNLYMGKNELGELVDDINDVNNINNVSYAGAITGIADGYNMANPSGVRSIYSYYTLSNLLIEGDLKFIGETVGGAFGLVGERTLVKDLNYNLTSETVYQGVYASGGLVGENRGIIQNSNIYAYTYVNGDSQETNTAMCFDNFARVNGGIVGINLGGLIDSCTSDIYINSGKISATAGGIVGRNIGGRIYDCIVSGKVNAFFAGGISGSDYTYNTIITQSSGIGTATYGTRQVYNFIKDGVVYGANCFVNAQSDIADKLYSNNTFTSKFINNFIAQKGKYYVFNQDYGENNNRLVNAYSVLGLVIGLTDVELGGKYYDTTIEQPQYDKDGIMVYNSQLVISLTLKDKPNGDSDENASRKEYVLDDGTTIVKPIANIKGELNKYDVDNNTSFIYIIANSSAGYEFWSSTEGYGDNYITISKKPLSEPYQG